MNQTAKETFEQMNPGKIYEEVFPPYPKHPGAILGNTVPSDHVRVTMTFKLPKTTSQPTAANVEEWLRFHLGDNGLLHGPEDNPYSLEPFPDPITFAWEFA